MRIVFVASASCQLFNTCCDPAVPFSLPTIRMDFFIQICNSPRVLYLMNELATMAEVFMEFAQQKIEGCSGFVFSDYLCWHFVSELHCLYVFLTISDIVSRLDILPTCDCFDLFAREVSLASQTFSISMAALIEFGYKYWKRLALWNRKGLACENKPTVCKHKQKQMQSFLNKLKLMVQRSLIKKIAVKQLWPNDIPGSWKYGLGRMRQSTNTES